MSCARHILRWVASGAVFVLPMLAYAQAPAEPPVAVPAAAPAPDAAASAPAADGSAPPADAPPPGPVLPKKLTTLLFTPAERQVLAQAKLFYSRQGLGDEDIYDEEELLKQLNNVKLKAQGKQVAVSRDIYYPQFYLESIIYHSPQDWKVRVREDAQSKEYWVHTPTAKDAPLKIISISREQVTFEWAPLEWQRVVDMYKEPSSAIFLDTEQQKVIFSLMVNQTLFSYDMTLREGQMNLVRTASAIPMKEDPNSVLPDLFSDDTLTSEAPAGEDPFTRDLPGVVNAYKNLDNKSKEAQP